MARILCQPSMGALSVKCQEPISARQPPCHCPHFGLLPGCRTNGPCLKLAHVPPLQLLRRFRLVTELLLPSAGMLFIDRMLSLIAAEPTIVLNGRTTHMTRADLLVTVFAVDRDAHASFPYKLIR